MNDSDLPLPPARTLTRSLDDRIIAGVAGGLARHFDMDPTIIRVIFGFLLVPGGLPGFLPYLILWAVMPDDAGQRQSLKKELLKLPVFGIYASRVGIPIDRAGGTKTMKLMLAAARKGAEAGQQIVIFPEGTRQLPDTPADIKPGVIFMYNELGIPCVPVALNTGLCWQGSGFLRKPGHVVFEVLPPIEPGLKRAEFTPRLKDALYPATQRRGAEGRAAQGGRG